MLFNIKFKGNVFKCTKYILKKKSFFLKYILYIIIMTYVQKGMELPPYCLVCASCHHPCVPQCVPSLFSNFMTY